MSTVAAAGRWDFVAPRTPLGKIQKSSSSAIC
jgi:hypothetical protein